MPLFNPSSLTVRAAHQEIADSAGASGDDEMINRAARSLRAAFEHFNSRASWDYLYTENPPVTVVAPFTVTGVSASAGQTSATAFAGHGFQIDDLLLNTGIVKGTRISATAAGSFGIDTTFASSIGTTNGINVVRDMYAAPSDFKKPYSARLLNNPTTLRFMRKRVYDRSVTDDFTASTPIYYGIERLYEKSKIKLYPPPAAGENLALRYYRRMSITTATASAITTGITLDIPQDYESYLIAWAKWHFLTDKGQENRATTWITFAEGGLKQMLADQTAQPDEDLMFLPGAASFDPAYGINSVRRTGDDYS